MPIRRNVACFVFSVIWACTGCSSHGLPPVKKIDQIRLLVTRMPDEKEHARIPRVATLQEQADIVELMDWLHTIDWSQSGTDLAAVAMPHPDGEIILINKSAATRNYRFYWDGGFVDVLNNRLIRGGDMDKLKQLVERVCK